MWLAETRFLLRRARVWILFAVLAAVPILLAVAVKIDGGPNPGNGPGFLDRVSHNGVFDALAGLTVTINLFLPLSVAIVAGDAISGEANLGTLRYLLVRPAGRARLLGVKAVVVAQFCIAAALVVAVAGLIAGAILFPIGPVGTLSGTSVSYLDGLGRALAAALVVGLSLLGLASVGLFLSTLVDVPVGAIATTVGVAVVSAILDSVPEVSFLHPWLLTNNWLAFSGLMQVPVRWHEIGKDLLLQLGYIAVFGTAAWARITSRDVLA
jgi:ABC-2 type transport system permease protein